MDHLSGDDGVGGKLNMRTISVLLTLALVGVCLGAEQKPASTPHGKEPTYEGRTLGEWVAQINDDANQFRLANVKALGKMGVPAIPALTALLHDRDRNIRQAAAVALGEMGSNAKAAVPSLTELLNDQDSWVRAFTALAL